MMSREEFDTVGKMRMATLRSEIQKGLDDQDIGEVVVLDAADLKGFADSIKAAGRKHDGQE